MLVGLLRTMPWGSDAGLCVCFLGSCAGNSPFDFMEESKQEGHFVEDLPVCPTL